MSTKIQSTKDGAIARIAIDNPARRNALSLDMWQAIARAVDDFARDDSVRVIVLRGAGNEAFAAGADISQFDELRANRDDTAIYEQGVDRAHEAIKRCPKPLIALIHGFCFGGGVALAISSDLRYAGASATFAIPAARLGLGYSASGVKRLIETVGHAWAREIFFTARRYSAQEALAMGLVHRVLPDAELDSHVETIARTIADNAPLTIAAAKLAIEEWVKPDGQPDFSQVDGAVARCFNSEDYAEGRKAFLEKRKPRFSGR